MIPKEALTIITVILFLIPVVIFIPTMIGESQKDTQTETMIVQENESKTLGQYAEMTVDSVNPSSADVTIVDTENGEAITHNIMENETQTFAFENGDIDVTLDDIHSDTRVVMISDYPSEFGWSEEESRVSSFMPYVILIPISIVLLLILLGVIGGED